MLESITGFVTEVVSEPVNIGWVIFAVILVIFIIFSLRQILDIMIDLWKLPFAIVMDALDLLAYNKPYLDFVAAIGNIIIFWTLAKRGHHLSKIFGFVAAAEAIIGIWILPQYAFITNILPTSTVLMFIAIWSD